MPPPSPRVPREDHVGNILAMVQRAEEAGAAPVVVLPLSRDPIDAPAEIVRMGEYRRALEEALRARGKRYVKIRELTEEGHPDNGNLFYETIHPNAVGHEIIASRLLACFREEKLLGDLAVP
jgi:hypothetical protein